MSFLRRDNVASAERLTPRWRRLDKLTTFFTPLINSGGGRFLRDGASSSSESRTGISFAFRLFLDITVVNSDPDEGWSATDDVPGLSPAATVDPDEAPGPDKDQSAARPQPDGHQQCRGRGTRAGAFQSARNMAQWRPHHN